MTLEEACEVVIQLGGVEYPDPLEPMVRAFEMPKMVGIPNCACNDRPPRILVHLYRDFSYERNGRLHPGPVQFQINGESENGCWLKAVLYSFRREEIAEAYPLVEKTARAVWTTFAETMVSGGTA